MIPVDDFGGRRAPYAPISALERFFDRIRDRAVPDVIDQRFLQKISVAHNNEYSLLSALKFLGILDDRGRPTTAYRQLQTTDRFEDTLGHLVRTAYRPVFVSGVDESGTEDLVNFFRVSSSPSQARNAARFFQAVCRLAGIATGDSNDNVVADNATAAALNDPSTGQGLGESHADAASDGRYTGTEDSRLRVKAQLLEKLPTPAESWSAQDYKEICALFVEMLRSLDAD